MNKALNRICIIGGGPCGLSLKYAFSQVKNLQNVEVTCLEKQEVASGLWNYSWKTGTDEHGLNVHASQYKCLWSNGPKECLEFPNYTFKEHFKKPIGSFPPRLVLRDYIMGRASKAGVLDEITYNTLVESVKQNEDESFAVTYRNLKDDTRTHQEFDKIVVATGHFSVPNIPTDIPNLENFEGEIMHSHNFRRAEPFKGRNVVVVGGSYSAEDIALQIHKYGANMVSIATRTSKMGFNWPKGIAEFGPIKNVNGKTIEFADGKATDVDTIILCTGYLYTFPFLEDKLRIPNKTNTIYPNGLYKGLAFINNPNVLYMGMQDQFYTFTMFDIQGFYVRDILLGEIELPNKKEMEKDAKHWSDELAKCKTPNELILYQNEYIKDLCSKTDYVDDFSKVEAVEPFFEWEHDKDVDITTYRDKGFTSVVDGTQAAVFNDKWYNAFDDSLEYFIDEKNNTYPKPAQQN